MSHIPQSDNPAHIHHSFNPTSVEPYISRATHLAKLVCVVELNLGNGGSPSRIMDDILDDSLGVSVSLGVVEDPELHGALAGSHVRAENGSFSLTTACYNLTHAALFERRDRRRGREEGIIGGWERAIVRKCIDGGEIDDCGVVARLVNQEMSGLLHNIPKYEKKYAKQASRVARFAVCVRPTGRPFAPADQSGGGGRGKTRPAKVARAELTLVGGPAPSPFIPLL